MCDKKAAFYCCRRGLYCGRDCQKIGYHWGHRCPHNHYKQGQLLYADNIELSTENNKAQFTSVYKEQTKDSRLQIVLQSVQDRVPWETHHHVTQFIRVESGYGYIDMHPQRTTDLTEPEVTRFPLGPGEAVVIPCHYRHQIVRTGDKPLKLYAIYAKDAAAPDWVH